MRWGCRLVVLWLVGACAGGAMAAVPVSRALPQATVGGLVTVSAQGADPGSYTLSLTAPDPTQGVICATKIAGPTRASHGHIRLTGKVPTRLSCYGSDGSLLTHVRLTPGTYTLFLCQLDGATSCDGSRTIIHHQVVVHAAPRHTKPKSH